MLMPVLLWSCGLLALLVLCGWCGRRWSDERARRSLVHMVGMLRLRSDAACLLDADGCIHWCNDAYVQLTGYTERDLLRRSWQALLFASVEDVAAQQIVGDALKARRELRRDVMFRSRRGEVRCMIVELHPLYNLSRRRFLGYLVVQIDIDQQRNERRMTLLALRDRQTVLDILDRHAIVTETDLQGRITRVNERFVQVSGYRADELLGRNHRMFNSGQHDAAFWRDLWETIGLGGIWHGEICNRAKDGSLYWLDSVIASMPGPDGKPAKYVSIRYDITALMRSRDMLARTGRIAGIGGWYCNLDTRTLYFTEAASEILALPGEQLRVDALPVALPSEMWQAFRERVRHTMATGEAFSQEIRIRQADGIALWMRVSCEVEYLNGRAHRLVGAVQDVSAQVEARLRIETSERILRSAIDALDEAFALYDAQERLMLCNDKYLDLLGARRHEVRIGMPIERILRLSIDAGSYLAARADPDGWYASQMAMWRQPSHQQRLQLSNGRWIKRVVAATSDGMRVMFCIDITDLQQALVNADSASRSKSQFLANMSHEIRTPMNAIMGLLQLIETTGVRPEQADLLRKTEGAARSLLEILNDILDFSKVEAGKMKLDPEPFALDELLSDVSTILSGTLGEKKLELIYDVDPAIPAVLIGDALRLKQVLINLGGNAIKFTARGEVRLALRLISLDDSGARLECRVLDTGIGINKEALRHIFTGFSQAEASISRRFGGTGLGLAISHRLVELMGGDLRVDSEPGKGSCFFFEIVLQPGRDRQVHLCGVCHDTRGAQALLLEPHPVSRAMLSRLLEQQGGWQVAACSDAMQAGDVLDTLHDWPVVALISAEASGHELLIERLRHGSDPDCPPAIVLATSHPRPPQAGMPVLCKPLTFSMLCAALRGRAPDTPPTSSEHVVRRLEGVRLLLVEDNDINQEVATRLLEREGARVRVAANGQQGLQALDAEPDGYDLVLMDMQMPVMDGLQATYAIRRDGRHAGLPIVAMTANAMQSDRDACMAAGMDAHIGKPFHLEDLVAVIRRHLRDERRSDIMETLPAVRRQLPVAPLLDGTAMVFDAPLALTRLGQDKVLYSRLLADFRPAAKRLLEAARTALEVADARALRSTIHQLKSTAAATGADRLAAACAVLEREVVAGGLEADESGQSLPAYWHDAVTDLEQMLAEALEAHAGWLAQHEPPVLDMPDSAISQASDNDLAVCLAALAEALASSDMAAFDLFDDLMARHVDVLGDSAAALSAAMADFNTDAALRVVQRVQARWRKSPAS